MDYVDVKLFSYFYIYFYIFIFSKICKFYFGNILFVEIL